MKLSKLTPKERIVLVISIVFGLALIGGIARNTNVHIHGNTIVGVIGYVKGDICIEPNTSQASDEA